MAHNFQVGQRLSYNGAACTVRFVGEVGATSHDWLGVEWDDPSRGKQDGTHKGVRYFTCLSRSPTAASFVRPSRPSEPGQSFLAALHQKYASEVTADLQPVQSAEEIVISGKVAEEVGFDKIRRRLAQLGELRIVILDGFRVAFAAAEGDKPIKEVSPKIIELDLSRNLFARFAPVVDICAQLEALRSLRVNGNRFQHLLDDEGLDDAEKAFKNITELAVEETLMNWDEMCHVASKFPALTTLFAGNNQLAKLSIISAPSLIANLTSLNLEYNDFTALRELSALSGLTSLRNLHLKGNNISSVTPSSDPSENPPVFRRTLHYVDISYNRIATWAVVDALPSVFPGLTSLRFAHNPIYDDPDLDAPVDPAATAPDATSTSKTPLTDEAYMLTIGRLASLRSLNFSTVTPADRTNGEMFYLGRIARQLASVPPASAEGVISRHARYAELCDIYGEPAVVRRKEINPNFLEARLVSVLFRYVPVSGGGGGEGGGGGGEGVVEKSARIPKSVDIYGVKGIVGRLFGEPPLKLKLIWETGEWDPVASYDDEAGGSSDEEDAETQREKVGEEESGDEEEDRSMPKGGKWLKREVELKDGPRQFGFCVDGLEATVRVELR